MCQPVNIKVSGNVKHSLVSVLGHDAMRGTQADLRAIVMDRATAGPFVSAGQASRPLVERESVCVCVTAVQSVNDKEESDVMGGKKSGRHRR